MDLRSLYSNARLTDGLHSRYYVEGLILGAASCPEIPMPNVWLPWLFKQAEFHTESEEINDKLFGYFKFCLNQMRKESLEIPNYVEYFDVSANDFKSEHNQPLQQWCEGLLIAHGATEQSWQTAWNKMHQKNPQRAPVLAKDLKYCLKMFTTFSDPHKQIERSTNPAELAKNLPIIAKSLSSCLKTYVDISGELASYLPNQFETFAQQQ